MKHNTDYKFSDKIQNVRDFFNALEADYSIGVIEKRTLANEFDSYQLTIYSGSGGLNVGYVIYTLDGCLKIATSRVDFMYHLGKRGYLVAAD